MNELLTYIHPLLPINPHVYQILYESDQMYKHLDSPLRFSSVARRISHGSTSDLYFVVERLKLNGSFP